MANIIPRAVRCCNPGNIDRTTPRAGWQGAKPDAELTDPRFEEFTTPIFGFRALSKVLIRYSTAYKLNTVRQIVNRWAPPLENNTDAYIKHAAELVGVDPDQPLKMTDPAVLQALCRAISRHEAGKNPGGVDWWSDAEIAAGVALALKG